MANIKTTYTLELEEVEAHTLKKLLGGMNDVEFESFGIKDESREYMRDIYNLIPHPDGD